MFKILFNRHSPVVRILELVGLWNSYRLWERLPEGSWLQALLLFLLGSYLFIRLCDSIPWYANQGHSFFDKKVGIRVHFQKALVPTSFILALSTALGLFDIEWLSLLSLGLADFFMLVVSPVNGILLWFHFQDREKLPVNYFSLNK